MNTEVPSNYHTDAVVARLEPMREIAMLDRPRATDPSVDADAARRRATADPTEVFVESERNLTTEPRESVSRSIRTTFPRPVAFWLEAFVTWVSGCPHRGQKPLVARGVGVYTAEAFGGFFLGIGLGHAAVVTAQWWAMPLIWLFVAGRTWSLFALFHHSAHRNLYRNQRANRIATRLISLLTFSSSFEAYKEAHIKSHHTRDMCRLDDDEGVFMQLGFPPGRSRSEYWKQLWLSLVLPGSYLRYLRYRLWDWQKSESWSSRLMTWGFALSLIAGAWYASAMTSLLLAYVMPLFVVFNATGLLGTFSEHPWGCLRDHDSKDRLVLLSQGRYLLDEAPDPELQAGRRCRRWVLWWARLLFYHLPVRVAILPGDSLHHDHHHRHPRTEDWTNSTYERADHVWNGCPGFPDRPHAHAWSLGEAIDRVFTRMAAAPPPGAAAADIG